MDNWYSDQCAAGRNHCHIVSKMVQKSKVSLTRLRYESWVLHYDMCMPHLVIKDLNIYTFLIFIMFWLSSWKCVRTLHMYIVLFYLQFSYPCVAMTWDATYNCSNHKLSSTTLVWVNAPLRNWAWMSFLIIFCVPNLLQKSLTRWTHWI